MSARLRHSAYTAYHVTSAGRLKHAILSAAARWWHTRTDIADCETAIANAQDADDGALAAVLEHAKLDAQAHAEHLYRDVLTLVGAFKQNEEWDGECHGLMVVVKWSAYFSQVSIYATRA